MLEHNPSSLILASASPRRKQLLSEAGYNFEVFPPNIDESAFFSYHINPKEYAKRLALAKAKNVAENFPRLLVIGADTIVDCNGKIIGKPCDAEDAERITRELFSTPHKVITGLAVVCLKNNIEECESDTTVVYPKKLSAEQITQHIRSRAWKDKAGAYAIQENGDEFVEKINGSLTNVMGLPIELLKEMLKRTNDRLKI